jgi:hypothetical protein
MTTPEAWLPNLDRLREFQEAYRLPVSDIAREAPAQALHSLRESAANAPANYRQYLEEAIDCYGASAYRGAVLMVWAATIEHIYSLIEQHPSGFELIEAGNFKRFKNSKTYRKISKKNDLLYVTDKNFFFICEDAGVFNKNARALLDEALGTRNRCGHPTGFALGREEVVIFIERMIKNFISGAMLDWS